MSRSLIISEKEAAHMYVSSKQLGDIVASRRSVMNMSRRQFAAKVGCTPSTITRWENGQFDATTVRLFNLILNEEDEPILEMWKRRAFLAEATLRDIISDVKEYHKANGELRQRNDI